MVACHLKILSPMGPALQFGGGSLLRLCNSLLSRRRAIYTPVSKASSVARRRERVHTFTSVIAHSFYYLWSIRSLKGIRIEVLGCTGKPRVTSSWGMFHGKEESGKHMLSYAHCTEKRQREENARKEGVLSLRFAFALFDRIWNK